MTDYSPGTMTVTKDDLGIEEVTAGKAAQTQTVEVTEGAEVVAEILKSLRMPRPKKDNQEMVVVHVSLRNPLRNKLSMKEKGKVFTIETYEEEEYLQDLIIAEEEDEGMEEDIKPRHSATKLPAYIPP